MPQFVFRYDINAVLALSWSIHKGLTEINAQSKLSPIRRHLI